MAETDKRDASGKFAKGHAGGPGRPAGMPNRCTVDGRIARQRFLDTWEPVGGDAKLVEFATKNDRNYETYLRVYCGLLPKETDLHVDRVDPLNMYAPGQEADPVKDEFYKQLVELAGDGPITSEVVMQQLETNRANRNGWRRPLPAGVNDHGAIEKGTE